MSTSATGKTRRPSGAPGSTPTRLPSTRERRPALAALGVLLVAGGALASAWLALQVSDRADYLVIAEGQDVVQGAKIGPDDLAEVSLPDDLDGAIPASEADDVVGQYARTSLLTGTILSPEMVEQETAVPQGFSIVSSRFDSGDLSDLAVVGSQVLLRVPPDDDGNDEPGAVRGVITVLDRGERGQQRPRGRPDHRQLHDRVGVLRRAVGCHRGRQPRARPRCDRGPGRQDRELLGRGHGLMGLLAVASAKGSPGVTTTALALGALWPRPVRARRVRPVRWRRRAAPARCRRRGARPDRGLLSLAAAGRKAAAPRARAAAQPAVLGGLDVVVGLYGCPSRRPGRPSCGSCSGR